MDEVILRPHPYHLGQNGGVRANSSQLCHLGIARDGSPAAGLMEFTLPMWSQGMGGPEMVLNESSLQSLPFPFHFSYLGVQWALPAHNNTVMRCGVLRLALSNQKILCDRAWGHWHRGSVAVEKAHH